MRIIVPMAGMGKRMRPHTLTIPKPLIPIAGKPIVQRLVEDISKVSAEKVEEIAFIVGDFGQAVEDKLIGIAEALGAKGTIFYQNEALGTAHAILCAKEALKGKITVAFADTLFKATFQLDTTKDGIIWTQQIDDPSQFGVVKMNAEGIITDFIEKPQEYVSDQAIIGIYFFKDGENLAKELQFLIDNKVIKSGEYQLTDALENMKRKGLNFYSDTVDEWLDCGNKNATVNTNQRVLINTADDRTNGIYSNDNSIIIEPCYIGEGVRLNNSIIGPHVSIEANATVTNSMLKNSMIQNHAQIICANIENSMVGAYAKYQGVAADLSISDYSDCR